MFSNQFVSRSKPRGEQRPYFGLYEPYGAAAANCLYNKAFCDDLRLHAPRPGEQPDAAQAILLGARNDAALVRALVDDARESVRTRLLGCHWLAVYGAPVAGALLGVVVEMHLGQGLETLAVYADGEVLYISHKGRTLGAPEDRGVGPVSDLAHGLLQAAAVGADPAGVLSGPRQAPPGSQQLRMTFLLPAGPLSTEGPIDTLRDRQHAGAVFIAASELMRALVDAGAPRV